MESRSPLKRILIADFVGVFPNKRSSRSLEPFKIFNEADACGTKLAQCCDEILEAHELSQELSSEFVSLANDSINFQVSEQNDIFSQNNLVDKLFQVCKKNDSKTIVTISKISNNLIHLNKNVDDPNFGKIVSAWLKSFPEFVNAILHNTKVAHNLPPSVCHFTLSFIDLIDHDSRAKLFLLNSCLVEQIVKFLISRLDQMENEDRANAIDLSFKIIAKLINSCSLEELCLCEDKVVLIQKFCFKVASKHSLIMKVITCLKIIEKLVCTGACVDSFVSGNGAMDVVFLYLVREKKSLNMIVFNFCVSILNKILMGSNPKSNFLAKKIVNYNKIDFLLSLLLSEVEILKPLHYYNSIFKLILLCFFKIERDSTESRKLLNKIRLKDYNTLAQLLKLKESLAKRNVLDIANCVSVTEKEENMLEFLYYYDSFLCWCYTSDYKRVRKFFVTNNFSTVDFEKSLFVRLKKDDKAIESSISEISTILFEWENANKQELIILIEGKSVSASVS